MSMKKYLLFILCGCILGPILIIGLSSAILIYSQHHNVSYVDEDGVVIASKMDGPFSYTEVNYCAATEECSQKGIHIEKKTWFAGARIRGYTDTDMEGKVDKLKVTIHSNYMMLRRSKNFRTHKKYFDNADKDLKKQLKRFENLLSNADK